MRTLGSRWVVVGIFGLLAGVGLAGCLGQDEEGSVAFYVKDAPSDDLSSLFVTFSRVDIHAAGGDDGDDDVEPTDGADDNDTEENGNETDDDANETEEDDGAGSSWVTIVNTTQTVDLKNFSGDARAFLGDANVSAGRYTQIRVFIDEAWGIMASDGSRVNVTVPSGALKVVRPFEIEAGETTVLTLDFDLAQSVRMTGNDQWRLQPVVQLLVEEPGDADEGTDEEEGDGNETGTP